jgi:NDP-sugar pyrophosphorylase family protein
MKAVILAAGKGVRMQPLTLDRPKQLVHVMGKPIIEHVFELLPEAVSEVILVVGYKGEMLRSHLGERWQGKDILYIEQKELLGTYPALLLAKPHLDPEERFLVVFADDLYDKKSFERLMALPRGVLVHEVDRPQSFGIALIDEEGKIADLEEKPKDPKSDLAVTGAYILDKHFFEYEPERHENGEYYFPPVIMKMIKDYPMYAERAALWLPIGYPDDVRRAEEILRRIPS